MTNDQQLTTDDHVVAHLRELQARGSHGLVAQLVDTLMSDTAAQLQSLRDAANRRDHEAIYRAAHTLQGSAAMVGAESIAQACAELARTARHGSLDHIGPFVAEIEAGVEAIRRAIAQVADELPSATAPPDLGLAADAGLARKRILVIDDDEGIRKITQMLVEGLGHDVEAARD